MILVLSLFGFPSKFYSSSSKSQLFDVIFVTAHVNSIDPVLLLSICTVESSLRPTVINKNDGGDGLHSYGLCQVQEATARAMSFKGDPEDLLNPWINSFYAGKYIRFQLERYQNVLDAISAYNAGRTLRKKGQETFYNQEYIDKVAKQYKKYKELVKIPKPYLVSSGDTLSIISSKLKKDYKELAYINNINKPYYIFVGQVIYYFD